MDNIYQRGQQEQDDLSKKEQMLLDVFSDNEESPMNDGSYLAQKWEEDDDRRDSDYVDPNWNGNEPAEVDELLRRIEEGEIPLDDAQQKGNYGEMKTDQYFRNQGYQRISRNTVTSLDDSTHQGIDGVYYNPNETPPFVVAEAKYGSGKLRMTESGKQMSKEWISERLCDAVGEEWKKQILEQGYQRYLFRVQQKGVCKCKELQD